MQKTVDVLVLGAGTAGAMTALAARRRGLDVMLVDRRPEGQAGARWVNGVELRLFDDLDLGPPKAPVLFHNAAAYHLEAPTSGFRVTVRDLPSADIDMRALNELVLARGAESGVRFAYGHRLNSVTVQGGAVRGAGFRETTSGAPLQISAGLTVDATGFDSALVKGLPPGMWRRELVGPEHICVATQQVRELTDVDGAKRFLDQHRLRDSETLCWGGVEGGYSILNIAIDLEHRRVALLTGAMLYRGQQSAVKLMERGLSMLGFVGRKLFGGGGLIPVRRAFDRLVGPGFALVGDSASQVFPAHGSGVAAGMRAGNILGAVAAEALRSGEASIEALWPYAARYQRSRGALCASHEWIRRFTEALRGDDLSVLLKSGAIDTRSILQSMGCSPVQLSGQQVLGAARVLSHPRLARRLLRAVARSSAALALYKRYPEQYDPRTFERWQRWSGRLFGEPVR